MQCLLAGRVGGDEAIAALDAQLAEGSILLFRRMAHAQLDGAKRKAVVRAALHPRAAVAQPAASGSWLTLGFTLGWSRGGGGGAPSEDGGAPLGAQGPQQQEQQGGEPGLTREDWARIEELLAPSGELRAAEEGGGEAASPFDVQLKTRLLVVEMKLALFLDEARGATPTAPAPGASGGGGVGGGVGVGGGRAAFLVLSGSLHEMSLLLHSYPTTLSLAMAVRQADLRTAKGALLSTGGGSSSGSGSGVAGGGGGQVTLADHAVGTQAAAAAAGEEPLPAAPRALELSFVRYPQVRRGCGLMAGG